jgi:hypothetical protein
MSLFGKVRDEDVQQSISVHVSHVCSHSCQRFSTGSHGDAGTQPHLFKDSLAFVVEEKTGTGIVGNVYVAPSIVVVVAEDNPKPISRNRADARLKGVVGEGPVAFITVEDIVHGAVNVGMTVRHELVETTVLVVLRGEIHVARHEEINIAIIIDICEGAAGAPHSSGYAGPGRNVSKAVLARVVIEPVATDAGDIQISPSVVVVVCRAGAHPKAGDFDAR